VTYRAGFTVRARADAVKQFHFLADRNPAAAARWYTGLEKVIAKLSKIPERHPIAEDESEQLGITVRQMRPDPPKQKLRYLPGMHPRRSIPRALRPVIPERSSKNPPKH
jgi:plasmid stabilization system protein ParE